jgi:DNA polymerase-3 subunit alpha
MEVETIKKVIAPEVAVAAVEDNILEDEALELLTDTPTEVEETKVITRLSMPSRKLKVKISNELLQELEKMQINFKLN